MNEDPDTGRRGGPVLRGAFTDPNLRWARAFLAPYWPSLLLVVLLSLLSTASSLALPYLSRALVDEALLARDAGRLRTIMAAFVVLTALGFLLNVTSGLRYTRVSAQVLFDMRLAVYRHLLILSPRYYAATRLGDIVARLNNDVGEIQRVASDTLLAWLGNVLFLVGTLAAMAWLDLRLFFVSVIILPLAVWVLARTRTRLSARVADLRQASADVGSFLVETLLGMKLVVGANAQAREIERFRRRNDGFVSALMRMQLASYVTGGVPGLIVSLGSLLVFLYGGGRVIDGTLTLGTFVAFIAYQMRVLGPVQGLMGLYASLATVQVSLARVREIVGADPEVVERADATPLPACRGAIGMDEVSFTFGRGTPTLDRVSFRVEAGERVAIVGPSGAGKSTIADLLRRLLDPDQGSVRLDGHDLRDLRLADVRQHVVLVDQDPFLFHATLAENIRYARPDASTDAVDRAARLAGLGPFIDRSAGGADTMVGERGTALSAGERQRVAIARALLAEPAVLVLDEATAALDPATEDEVRRGYEAAMGRRTTVLITHRPHLARRADRILVFDGASLVEQGTPDELEARRGRFTALFQSEGAAAPAGRAEDRG